MASQKMRAAVKALLNALDAIDDEWAEVTDTEVRGAMREAITDGFIDPKSDFVLPEHRPAIRALFPAARFVGVKGAGHWVHADNPAGFLAVLHAFLHDWAA